MKASSAYLFPSIKKQACKEKLLCANTNIQVETCSKCNMFGQIISDMSVCQSNLLKFQEERLAYAEICSEFTKAPGPVDSVFRSFGSSEAWDFNIISKGLVAVSKRDLSECRQSLPNFACFDMNQTNREISDYFRFNHEGELKSQGKINSGIFYPQDLLIEDDYNTLKVLSQGVITVNETKYDVFDYYSSQWINSGYFVDCGSIKPVDPYNPDKPGENGGIGAFGVILIVAGSLVAVGGAAYGIMHFIRKSRSDKEALLG